MIKFRVWDKNTNDMVSVKTIDLERDGSIGCIVDYSGINLDVSECVLMQSTGLKDKNGVEIFEGDVCRMSGGLEDYWYIVEWLFAGWQLVTYKKPDAKVSGISDGINQSYLEPDIACNLTIVGNIYANPELLSNP